MAGALAISRRFAVIPEATNCQMGAGHAGTLRRRLEDPEELPSALVYKMYPAYWGHVRKIR